MGSSSEGDRMQQATNRQRRARIAATWALALAAWLVLAAPTRAQEADAAAALAAAEAAYAAKDYEQADREYARTIAAGDHRAGTYYDAACTAALAGRVDRGFALLQSAVDAGYSRAGHARRDPDLAALRADPRWPPFIAALDARYPDDRLLERLMDSRLPASARYFEVRRALDAGMPMPDGNTSPFPELYGTAASMVGEYDEARATYLAHRKPQPLPGGYDRVEPALPEILARAGRTRVVLLNESHAEAQTRASNFSLLAPLRALGFTHLGIEALDVVAVPASAVRCAGATLSDTQLPVRGYPLGLGVTGYYTQEPVFGELLREALRLGFELVAYETPTMGESQQEREQAQADNLACVLKDPKAKLVVIGGFGHIREALAGNVPGGAMGYRLRQATGIDPLSVDSTVLARTGPGALEFPTAPGVPGEGWVLRNAEGQAVGNADYDLILFLEAPAHRNDDGRASWLQLGGARQPVAIDADLCAGRRPCLLQAHAEAESADAVPSDRCVLVDGQAGCRLFLRAGKYRVQAEDEHQAALGQRHMQVPAGG